MTPVEESEITIPIDPDAHDYGDWTDNGAENHKKVCSRDETHVVTEAHSWVDIFDESLIVPGGSNDPCTGLVQCYQTCEVCGRTNDAAHVFTVSEGSGHSNPLIHHEAVDSDCVTAGNIEYWTCDLCGVMFSDENHTVEVTDVSTPALNHEGIAPVEQVNATCTEPGVKAHAECPLCGKMFSDVTASHEVNADDLAIPAKGHDFHGAIQDKDASEHWYKCTRCDVYGGAEAHSYTRALAIDDAKKSDTTCTASATYYYSCACGRINNAEGADTFTVGSPTGHAYNSVKAGSWTWTRSRMSASSRFAIASLMEGIAPFIFSPIIIITEVPLNLYPKFLNRP